jgi:hypothetical protein
VAFYISKILIQTFLAVHQQQHHSRADVVHYYPLTHPLYPFSINLGESYIYPGSKPCLNWVRCKRRVFGVFPALSHHLPQTKLYSPSKDACSEIIPNLNASFNQTKDYKSLARWASASYFQTSLSIPFFLSQHGDRHNHYRARGTSVSRSNCCLYQLQSNKIARTSHQS